MPQIRTTIEDIDLETGFLNLPVLDSISLQPPDHYDLPTKGRIHTSTFIDLVKISIEKDRSNWRKELTKVLGTHVQKNDLLDLNFNQFIDYLLHIIAANESIKYTEMATIRHIILKENEHIPRWNLPSLEFREGVSNLLSTIIKISVSESTIERIRTVESKLAKTKTYSDLINHDLLEKLESENRINISQIFNLIGNLRIIQYYGIIKYTEFPKLMNQVNSWCKQIWETKYLDTHQKRILFASLNTIFFITREPKRIKQAQILLQEVEQDLVQLPEIEKQSYQWLIDAGHAVIANYLMQYEIEAVTEDVLLKSLGSRFIEPEKADLATWKQAIITTGIHPLLSIILLKGYMAVSNLLRRYKTQLHKPKLQEQHQIDSFILDILQTSQVEPKTLTFFSEITITDLYIETVFKHVLRDDHTDEMVAQLRTRINDSPISKYYQLLNDVVSILTDTYNFEENVVRIGLEEHIDLIGNPSFEKLVISPYAKAFKLTQTLQENTNEHMPQRYNLLRFYLFEWLIFLLDEREEPVEAIMILLPFIKICDSLLQSYYSIVNHKTMCDINQINIFLLELNLSIFYNHPSLTRLTAEINTEEVIEEVKKLLGKFNLKDQIDKMDMKFYVLEYTEDLPYITRGNNQSTIQSDKLQDENMMHYMELGDQLQQCLQRLNGRSKDEIKKWFSRRCISHDAPIFELEDHYGNTVEKTPIIFPFMKPTAELATALRFFSIDFHLDEIELPS